MRSYPRWRLVVATALMVGLPAAAYVAAPAQAGSIPAAPGSELAGLNTNAVSAGAQVELLIPGIVPLGDPTKGNFVQASLPYSNSVASTGPTTGSVSSPAWPGDAAATAGNAIQTFSPSIPAALVHLLNDPLVARADYPEQVGVGSTGSFTPTGPAGFGSASAKASLSETTGNAAITDLNPLGAAKSGIPFLQIASATSATSSTVAAASVGDNAETRIGRITIAGVITIDGINTTATASSDGKKGTPGATTDIGKVTVAGVAASIGPDGITLQGKGGQAGTGALISTANKVLAALQKLGVSIRTLDPKTTTEGANATATSGGVLVTFQDNNLPDLGKLLPQLPIPVPNSLGVEVSLGLSQASAAATLLPTDVVPPATSGSAWSGPPGSGVTVPGLGGGLPPIDTGTTQPGGGPPVIAAQPSATEFGLPVRTAWVVIAFLIAVLAAGPLLTYANWQLLRGRTP